MPHRKAVKIVDSENESRFYWLMPIYSENTLLLMALTTIFLFLNNSAFRSDLNSLIDLGGCLTILAGMFVAYGLFLSILHPFLSRKKNFFEKAVMAIFVIAANGGAGLYAGYLALFEVDKQYIIFPVINILFFFFISVSMVGGWFDKSISDENVDLSDVTISAVCLIVIFVFCTYFLELHWTYIFSICIGYSTIAPRLILKVFDLAKTISFTLNKN
jgi:hypothetical protein